MSVRIPSPPTSASVRDATAAGASPEAKQSAELAKVGRDFEAILVRQLLTSTHVAGKSGGYEDMAVESLASSITAAGGLGLGRAIEDALRHATHGGPATAPAEILKK